MKQTTTSQLKYLALFACIALVATPVLAQVSGGSSGDFVARKTNTGYLIIAGIAGTLMAAAWTMAGYKFIFVENTKLTDLKNLVIGGLCCGGAGAFSYFFLS